MPISTKMRVFPTKLVKKLLNFMIILSRKNVYVFIQVRFNGERVNHGFLKEWTLMMHGTREPPYSDLPVTDPHSKLAIVKKAHEDKKKM